MFLSLLISGCTETENNTSTSYKGTLISEEFIVNDAGGVFSTSGDEVILNIADDVVDQEIRLTVQTIKDFPMNPEYLYVVGYRFGPLDIQILKSATLQIHYSQSDVPSSIDERNLKMYLYENGILSEVPFCSTYPEYDYVQGQISKLGEYWICCSSSSSGTSGGTSGSSSNTTANTSSVYTFDVMYMEIIETHTKDNRSDWYASERYGLKAYFIWDPVPYVRYYEIELHTNGTQPIALKSGSWREMMYYSSGGSPQERYHEGDVYILGEYQYYPGYGQYLTIYDNIRSLFPDKHGFDIFGVYDNFDISDYSYSSVPEADVERYIDEMNEFFYEYIDGWTVTVRAVT